MQTTSPPAFWQYSAQHWYAELGSAESGLTQQAAEKRLQSMGHRTRRGRALRRDLKLFLGQFRSPLMLLLLGAVVLSLFLGDTSDVFIILFMIALSSLLSFFQERNAGKVVEKLQSMIALKATVLRDGEARDLPADQVVPGDVLILNAGDMIPADCLILEAAELHVNEASLTGESFPARKSEGVVDENTELSKRSNCLWEGANIVSGNAKALIVRTGESTLFGSLGKSAQQTLETSFEKGLRDFGGMLMKITLLLSAFILVVNLLNHKKLDESALFALALAVGMAPELLPAITTIAMSAGARRLLHKKVVVKKLNAIQNLGEVNLLCTDKTGTLTEGTIQVAGIADGMGQPSDFAEELAYWNAFFETGYTNPIDEALRHLKPQTSLSPRKLGEVPYDFVRRRISVAIQSGQQRLLVSKGAVPQILDCCTKIRLGTGEEVELAPHRADLESRFAAFGESGLRAIGVCYKSIATDTPSKELEIDMVFAGFVCLSDPVKPGIAETIAALDQLKVGLKIITGDNERVAVSIARQIGISHPVVVTGKKLSHTSPEALGQLVKRAHIFAEVEPQQKERIILALKKSYTVAYMGDGINDVSAIRAADVGISVHNAVDIARESADFVLLEKHLQVLAEGITEGRKTFANTLKYLYISTGSTFGNICSVAAASLVLPFLPMLPKQILLTNFITDFPFLTVASDRVDPEQLHAPGKWDLRVIRRYMVVFGIHSSLFDLLTFVALFFVLRAEEAVFRTGWFVESTLSELCILFVVRTRKRFFESRPDKWLLVFSGIAVAVILVLPYWPWMRHLGFAPLPPLHLGVILGLVVAYLLTADRLKRWFFRHGEKPRRARPAR
jgi:Mg2+-importing ATPase